MAAKQVRWAFAARADLLEALEHIVDESPQAAWEFLEEVESAAASLSTFPERGTRVREVIAADLRQLLVGRCHATPCGEPAPGVRPLLRLRRGPNQSQILQDFANGEPLPGNDHSGALRLRDELVCFRLEADAHQRTAGVCLFASASFW